MCPVSRFQPQKSITFKSTNIPFGYYYGDGEINGTYVKDTVTLDNISVPYQPFALADRVSKSVIAADAKRRDKYDTSVSVQGVLGLGFPDLVQVPKGSTKYNPFFSSILQSQGLNGIFSIYTNSIKGWSEELTLGGFNTNKLKGNISFASVSPISIDGNNTTPPIYSMWVTRAQSIGVSNIHQNKTIRKTILPLQQEKYVMIDTGTTLSYVGGFYARQLVNALSMVSNTLDKKNRLLLCKL